MIIDRNDRVPHLCRFRIRKEHRIFHT
jgi:hypothetical protein